MARETVKVADRVYAEIRRAIVQGNYQPHQRLVETDLATELAASRTPIRQGLQRLELEGLVSAARFGWVVRSHTSAEIQELYEVRIPLEGYAARLAAERASAAELEHLREVHAAGLDNLEPANRDEFVRLHDELHDTIFRAAHNEVLREAILGYRQHPHNMRVAHSYTEEELRAAVEGHAELVAAISARDARRAEKLARNHLILSRQASMQRLERFM